MTTPVYVGMPSKDTTFDVPKASGGIWGNIRCGGPCKDDYARIVHYVQNGQHALTLQKSAMDSLQAAEEALGFKILCTGSWRSCAQQAGYYASDMNRYAPPSVTAHCRGLAIDISMSLPKGQVTKARAALAQRGWHQARPDDEPWHASFGIQV